MANNLASTRRKTALEQPYLMGHCTPSFVGGKPDCGNCDGKREALSTTANYPKGTVIYCQHDCHKDAPAEAWPGRNATLAVAPQEDAEDLDDAGPMDSTDEDSEAPSETPDDAQPEPEPTSEVAPAPKPSKRVEPPLLDGEVRRIRYLEGWVVKTVENGVTEWLGLGLDGVVVGNRYSLRDAKSLIGAK